MNRIHTLICFILTLSPLAYATDYYVSSSGDDNLNNGKSSSTPWKTITKVNSVFPTFQPSDRILFNRGDIFYGTITIAKSGSTGKPIIIGAYGTGDSPIITGFTTITGWTNEGSGLYSKVVACSSAPNIVIVNGVNTPIGRYPDSGWLTIDSHVTNTSITDATLPSFPDWYRAEVVIRKNHWIIDRNVITNHTGTTITYTSGSTYNPINGNGYFIQNNISALTRLGEWFYGAGKLYMYFGANNPDDFTVNICTLDELVQMTYKDYITIENLTFEGANLSGLYIGSCSNLTVQNCKIGFMGNTAIDGRHAWSATPRSLNCLIDNNIIHDCNNIGIDLCLEFTDAIISNNTIRNIGMIPGMGSNGDGTSTGIMSIAATNVTIQFNIIENIGYIPIYFTGNAVKVKNNFIKNYCLVKDDGGAIYTFANTGTNREITNNIILNGIGAGAGTANLLDAAEGIYCDDMSTDIIISGNTIYNVSYGGIMIHNNHEITISNNTVYDCDKSIVFIHDNYGQDNPIRNITCNNNIFFAKGASQVALYFSTIKDDISSFGTADNNYFARPLKDDDVFYTNQPSTGTKLKTLVGWQSLTNQDLNSHKSPITISNVNDIRFEYNASNMNKVVTLDKPMINVNGTKYQSSITLLPFTSAVLIVDPNPAKPDVPVYTSSAIENATPSILEMTYDLTLANSAPVSSSFVVTVNSVNRAVSSVTVSGTKVQLTLASPVAFGDVVTVAYNKPATNPLQTAAGGQAASLTAQTVTNKVSSGAPVYVSSVVENATPYLLEMSYDLSLSNLYIPSPSAFTVMVNSAARTVSNVAIVGGKVRLTLSSPVIYGNVVTIAYTKPATNPLQTSLGGQAATITAKSVTNNAGPQIPVFQNAVVENISPTIIEMNYDLTLENSVPVTSAFMVRVNSVNRTISSVAIVSGKVRVTLASPVSFGDLITLSYTKPSTGSTLKIPLGAEAATITSQIVINNINPVNPVYLSSVIEDATPNILEMTYDLILASIIPSTGAFNVQVNSVSRNVSSVAIVSGKVRLTLSSPVVYGNVITISYTKPTSNPLQTASGGQAENISTQLVTNKCFNPAVPNKLPVITIFNNDLSYSGFVYDLDASLTNDPDGDLLTYEWTVPTNVPVSSKVNSKIQFLAPVVSSQQNLDFTLKVNDGRDISSKSITITVMPYKPELGDVRVTGISAGGFQAPDIPDNIMDDNLLTKWSVNGNNQWILFKLAVPFKISHLYVAFLSGQRYESYFDIYASIDNLVWEPILIKAASCNFSGNVQIFDFPSVNTSTAYSYVKLIGHGSSINTWNIYSEFRIFGMKTENPGFAGSGNRNVMIYPNPAQDIFRISIEEPTFEPDMVRLIDFTGRIVFEKLLLEPGIKTVQIPANVKSGIYLIELRAGLLILDAQKLIINRSAD